MVEGVRAGVVVMAEPFPEAGGQFAPVAVWPEFGIPGRLLTEAADRALADRQAVALGASGGPFQAVALACPIRREGRLAGVVALEIAAPAEGVREGALYRLQWGATVLEAALARNAHPNEEALGRRLSVVLAGAALVLEGESVAQAGAALVTDLAARFSCDRVSLCLVRNGHARLTALSHSTDFSGKSELIRSIEAAADEALDQHATLVHPPSPGMNLLVLRDHAALAREHGGGAVLSVPFSCGDNLRGVICWERALERSFDEEEIDLCEALVAFATPILALKLADELPLRRRLAVAARRQLMDFLGPRFFGRKVAALAVGLLVAFFSLATGEYRVAGKATIEGQVRRALVAPFDGYVGDAVARAGDVVAAGSVLASLDDRDLRLERLRWASQHAQFTRQFEEAMAKHDRGQALIFQAQIQQAEAQLVLAEEQLARAALVAPFAGLVASGDLSQMVGGTVRKGQVLFEMTPLDGYRVIIDVDESEVTDLRPGQKGSLVLSSIADQSLPLVVSVVTPVTTVRDGANVFRVEAVLERYNERLRPGMEGVAKVAVDDRRLIWIWTHRLVNWLRMAVWSWLP